MQKIKVLVVDDHTIVRDGISALLALAGDIEVVGEATNGSEALNRVRELNPDVVLMDIAMPVMGGLEATRRIQKETPLVKVLVLTQYQDSEGFRRMVEAVGVHADEGRAVLIITHDPRVYDAFPDADVIRMQNDN